MRKKAGKSASKSARKSKTTATKDLPASDAKTRNVKGGFLGSIGKSIGGVIKTVAPAVLK
jgi:hypothetical protein